MLVGVRQQGEEACALDRNGELALIERLRARNAAWDDLARLSDVALQRGQIFVINVLDAFGCEAAKLLPARETATAASTATAITTAVATTTTHAAGATAAAAAARTISAHCHLRIPLRVDAVNRASDVIANRDVFVIRPGS